MACPTCPSNSSNLSGRLSSADGSRKPCSTRVSLRLRSPGTCPDLGKRLVRLVGHDRAGPCPGDARAARGCSGCGELLSAELVRSGARGAPCCSTISVEGLAARSVDESHQTLPQVGGMYRGTAAARRPWSSTASGSRRHSTTGRSSSRVRGTRGAGHLRVGHARGPGTREGRGVVVEQIIRPTGLVDPEVEVRPVGTQVDDLLAEVRKRAEAGERVLVTRSRSAWPRTSRVLHRRGRALPLPARRHRNPGAQRPHPRPPPRRVRRPHRHQPAPGGARPSPRSRWWPSSTPTRRASCAPKVSLVQTIGRAARNVNGRVILYADSVTESMRRALSETDRRREIQRRYNEANASPRRA